MEKLIVIEGKEKYQYIDLKSLVQSFINSNYYNMREKEKQNELEKKAIANTIQSNIKIIKINSTKRNFEKDEFVINNEITYILSLLRFNKIVLLEKIDANIFGRYIDKTNLSNNYIILNKFADEILEKYINNK